MEFAGNILSIARAHILFVIIDLDPTPDVTRYTGWDCFAIVCLGWELVFRRKYHMAMEA